MQYYDDTDTTTEQQRPATVATARSDPEHATRNGTLACGCSKERCCACVQCRRFKPGDRIELSPIGITILGRRMVTRGTVKGQVFTQTHHHIAIQVNWDGMPKQIIGTIEPLHIQRIYGETHVFI